MMMSQPPMNDSLERNISRLVLFCGLWSQLLYKRRRNSGTSTRIRTRRGITRSEDDDDGGPFAVVSCVLAECEPHWRRETEIHKKWFTKQLLLCWDPIHMWLAP